MEGRKRVETSAAASFKVVKIGSGRVIDLKEEIGESIPRQVYYGSRREPGVIIQKAFKRISSAGEKREITQRGIAVSRTKGLFKKMNRRRR